MLHAVYTQILAAAELGVDADGNISSTLPEMREFELDGKVLCLPTDQNLRNPNGRIFFHPFAENFLKPESEVFVAFKSRLVQVVNYRIMSLIEEIVRMAIEPNKERQPHTPGLVKVLSSHAFDETFLKSFASIIRATMKVRSEFFVDIFVKSKGKLKDTSYEAVGKVVWLLAEDLEAVMRRESDRMTKTKSYAVHEAKSVRKSDVEGLLAVHQALFGTKEEREETGCYAVSNSFARFFEGVCWTSLVIATKLNPIIHELNIYRGKEVVKPFPVEWVNSYANQLAEIRKEAEKIGNLDRIVASPAPSKPEAKVSLTSELAASAKPQVFQRPPVLPQQPTTVTQERPYAAPSRPQIVEPIDPPMSGKIPFDANRLREQYGGYQQERGRERYPESRQRQPSVSELLYGDPYANQPRGGYVDRRAPATTRFGRQRGRMAEPELYPLPGRTDRYGNQVYEDRNGDLVVETDNGLMYLE